MILCSVFDRYHKNCRLIGLGAIAYSAVYSQVKNLDFRTDILFRGYGPRDMDTAKSAGINNYGNNFLFIFLNFIPTSNFHLPARSDVMRKTEIGDGLKQKCMFKNLKLLNVIFLTVQWLGT